MARRSPALPARAWRPALALALALPAAAPSASEAEPAPTLRVLTFNVWHGLRGERKLRLPGEDEERRRRRFDWQIEQIRALDPDVLLLQEVNPNARESRRWAEALGYDRISKVTNCGLHLPPIKIPSNMNEGLAILARPGLGLREAGSKRLGGDARCTATFGFQTRESRYVLLGEIALGGRPILLATTHLSSPPRLPPDFEATLSRLADEGDLTPEQRDEILATLEHKRARHAREVEGLLRRIDRHRRADGGLVVLGGDLNVEPSDPSIAALAGAGLASASAGRVLPTFDPVRNRANHEIGVSRKPALPTFGVEELQRALARREAQPRQIDYVLVSEGLRTRSTEVVLDRPREGIYPSDHFGLLSTIEVAR